MNFSIGQRVIAYQDIMKRFVTHVRGIVVRQSGPKVYIKHNFGGHVSWYPEWLVEIDPRETSDDHEAK